MMILHQAPRLMNQLSFAMFLTTAPPIRPIIISTRGSAGDHFAEDVHALIPYRPYPCSEETF